MVVQTGDYAKAYERLANGGPETFHAQRYSVQYVQGLTDTFDAVLNVSCIGEKPSIEELAPGLFDTGVDLYRKKNGPVMLKNLVQSWRPTHLLLRTPNAPILEYALQKGITVIPVFADSFEGASLRGRFQNRKLAKLLNGRQIRFVGNHNLPASRSLQRIGVSPEKIVPWEWPQDLNPKDYQVKLRGNGPFQCLYVGRLTESKGAGDLIDVVLEARRKGLNIELDAYGTGALHEDLKARVDDAAEAASVRLHGLHPRETVIAALEKADCVIIPSRPSYSDGMPRTVYEALATRTPVLMSEHPVFRDALAGYESVAFFDTASPSDFADKITQLSEDVPGYQARSEATAAAWQALMLGMVWGEMMDALFREDPAATDKLAAHTLATFR